MNTQDRLTKLAGEHGWQTAESSRWANVFTKGQFEISVGYTNLRGVDWLALLENGQPMARYGLRGENRSARGRAMHGGGDYRSDVKHKDRIAEAWLRTLTVAPDPCPDEWDTNEH